MKHQSMPLRITRREFLRHSLLGAAGWTFAQKFSSAEIFAGQQNTDFPKGRVLRETATLFSAPAFTSHPIGHVGMNTVVDLLESVTGQADEHGNDSWYRIANALYLHASEIQPVEEHFNLPELNVSRYGKLAMVTRPYTRAWKAPFSRKKEFIIIYYGSNHWITGVIQAEDGSFYYRIEEDQWQELYYVEAKNLYFFTPKELEPISTQVLPEEKRLEVDLSRQQVTAYENEKAVFQSPMSSGLRENHKDYSTPPGEYTIILKRPSRHMTHNDRLNNTDSELYGVPWVCNFTESGIAFHGTYWHNEFTYPHSHGCINLPIEAARWIYCWSEPSVPLRERKFVTRHGTRVIVF